ncbi:ABC transporter substrate-binding protein [Brachybacterium sp. GCM10030267]|uniref:ABC transporter substrate-binding protein n=1 Tax=Brachybacterium sp. GCM10030267 TaxID=3273381 RepID=UPI003607ABA3
MRRRSALGLGAAGAAALVTGCVPLQPLGDPPERPERKQVSAAGRPLREGGHLVMALSSEPDRLDPTTSSSLYTRFVMQTMCEKLYDISADGEIVPMLATELPTISEDGLTVEIPLKDGVLFADGAEFDAEAVRLTLERHLTLEGSTRASELGPITAVEAIESLRVRVKFESPFAPFTAALADRAGMIMSPQALDELGEDFGNHPVGVGAFKFVRRVPQTAIEVEADPLYYDADNVHLDRITYRIMTDANIRAANIQSGDVHVADSISPQDFEALQAVDGVGTLQVESLGYQGLTVNVGHAPEGQEPPSTPLATDERVRQALSHAVDRNALVNTVFNGWYTAAGSPISPSSPYASPESRHLPAYDPDAAKALLEEAGVEIPYPVRVTVSNTQDGLRYAQALQAQAKEAGFAIHVAPMEYTAVLDAQSRGDFEVVLLGWSGRVDPHGNAYSFWTTGGGNNYPGVSDPEVDQLLEDATQVTDIGERAEVYGEAVARMQEVNAFIYLYRVRSLTAHRDDVAGVAVYADGVVHLSHAAFLDGDRS